jgi:predicted nuclease of restriction endonuclease-like (RecB) superfamily
MPDNNYTHILQDLKSKIQSARQRAILAVNSELLFAYWEIGNTILVQQKNEGWGTKVIGRLIADLRAEFPDMKGLSPRNFKYMRAFAQAYPQFMDVRFAKPQEYENQDFIIVQQLAAQLPWTHHQVLLDKTKTIAEKSFYIKKAVENGWSRNVLLLQLSSQLHLRQGKALTNFELTLPEPQSDLAIETFKNPYVFDFLNSTDVIRELGMEKALIQHIKHFMLELGRGFAYVGNQYNIRVEDDEFFLDILFFNYRLNCFVIVDLKLKEFKPEHAGKLNFYINVIDAQVKLPHHKPTIGILLCKSSNQTIVKYALQDINSPIGISNYELTNALPKELKADMPTIEELEQEMEKEIEMHKQSRKK